NPQPKALEQPAAKTGAWPKATPAPAAPRPAAPAAPRAAEPAPRRAPAPPPPPTPARQQAPVAAAAEPVDLGADDAPEEFTRHRPDAVRKRNYGPLLVAAVMLAVVAGGGYGIWLNRDAFGAMI